MHATRCGNGIGGEFEKAFSKARTGNLLIVSPFVTKRATVFKYSMNGAESIGGKKFFHGGRLRGAVSNLQKLSRNKFCIHSRDTFHSRRLPRTRATLIPCLASLPFRGRGSSIYLNCNLSIDKLIVCVFPLYVRIHPFSSWKNSCNRVFFTGKVS